MERIGASQQTPVENGRTSRGSRQTPVTQTIAEASAGFTTNRVLGALPVYVVKRLLPYLREVEVAKDAYLFQQDEVVRTVYFPDTAVISEFQILEDGRTIEVSIEGNESAVGVAAALGTPRAINCAQVCIGGRLLKINADYLEREMAGDEALQRLMHSAMARQMKQLSQKVICNTFHSVEQRLCTWLLMLNDRTGSNVLRITHEHVARVLGVHRPSITCIAQGLRQKGLIDYSRGRLIVRDRAKVEKSACICYSESEVLTNLPATYVH